MVEYNAAAINWGFVTGKSQTHFPWESRKDPNWKWLDVNVRREAGIVVKPGEAFPEPELWFHDLFRMDGTPFDEKEFDIFRELTGKVDARDAANN